MQFVAFCFAFGLLHRHMRGSRSYRLLCVVLALFFSLCIIEVSYYLFAGHFSVLTQFNFARVRWLNPPLWSVAMALGASTMMKAPSLHRVRWIFPAAILVFGLYSGWSAEGVAEYETFFVKGNMPLREFLSSDVYEEIKNFVHYTPEQGRVVSIGIDPNIAVLYGFHTADGYWGLFPRERKWKFREVIATTLAADKSLRGYFDPWGCRVHMFFLGQGPKTWRRPQFRSIAPTYNTEAMRDIGVRYVLSAYTIRNAEPLGWRHLGRFSAPRQRTIEVYELPVL